MCTLHQIWSEIGICESQRQERSNTVMLHLRNLLDEMVKEEETLKNQIVKRIDKYTLECGKLCSELGLPAFEVQAVSDMQIILFTLDVQCTYSICNPRAR